MELLKITYFSLIGAVCFATSVIGQQQFVSIGTGSVTGTFYSVGGAICRLVNKERKSHGFRCSVQSTGGSIYNLGTVRAGELDFGIVQSDRLFASISGTDRFEDSGDFHNIRAVLTLHPLSYTVMSPNTRVGSLQELIQGGGDYLLGRNFLDDGLDRACNPCEQGCADKNCNCKDCRVPDMISNACNSEAPTVAFVAPHPSAIAAEMSSCGLRPIELGSGVVERLLSTYDFLRPSEIPTGMYGNEQSVPTVGLSAMLITSADVEEEAVYALVEAVMTNLDSFRRLHPALSTLEQTDIAGHMGSVPLHPGAEKYFKEAGLQ
ncbi:TAXI family TRAP transporter solute-binding subunit [Sedimentitalea todarodis]|uniref:TAXI family TRAP transporter solute-binding subunit n=1 Tax=Sedimentitalea todarodis TaxID=1631240 RepID=A0ABU3VM07_9RHOB|nr:TAXI family TRAP transporter solute-binding subunit [Sedimentitalea todarodis]MDU9007164.1 TAXI family TRAP transporter solute-binding subunit [Sedimentitalea todarodis]